MARKNKSQAKLKLLTVRIMQSVTLDTHTHTCGASLECVSPASLIVCGFVSASFVLAHVSRVCYLKRLSVQPGHPVSVYFNCRSLPFLSHCRFLSYYAISIVHCPPSVSPSFFSSSFSCCFTFNYQFPSVNGACAKVCRERKPPPAAAITLHMSV